MIQISPETITQLLVTLKQMYPGFQLVKKATILGDRCTTVGEIIYVPATWDTLSPATKYIRLQHEMVHLAQYKQYGTVGFLARYALLPLPIGFAWYRYSFEREAFYAEMKALLDVYGPATLRAKRNFFVEQFTGKNYYWSWLIPGSSSVEKWVDDSIATLIAAGAAEAHP